MPPRVLAQTGATKFSNMIGYQQPDLSINRAVARHACNLDSTGHFARAVSVHFVE